MNENLYRQCIEPPTFHPLVMDIRMPCKEQIHYIVWL